MPGPRRRMIRKANRASKAFGKGAVSGFTRKRLAPSKINTTTFTSAALRAAKGRFHRSDNKHL